MKQSVNVTQLNARLVFTIMSVLFALEIGYLCDIVVADEVTFTSYYTSIKDVDCFETPKLMTAYYDRRQLDADECPAPRGWRLFRVFSLDSFWIDIAYGDSLWSTENIVRKGLDYANPSIRPDGVEWRMVKSESPNALIFKIATIDAETSKILSSIYVLNIVDNVPYYCGNANSFQEARNIANATKPCKRRLPNINFLN